MNWGPVLKRGLLLGAFLGLVTRFLFADWIVLVVGIPLAVVYVSVCIHDSPFLVALVGGLALILSAWLAVMIPF